MVAFELKTKQDIQDFATGCCFFGCGGGGDPEAGIVALTEVLEKGKPLQVCVCFSDGLYRPQNR